MIMQTLPLITLTTTSGLALLASLLAIQVIIKRVRLKIESGDGANQSMAQAVRAHANFGEHVPIALLTLGACEISGVHSSLTLGCALSLILARVLSAVGLSRSLGPSVPRQAGASITIIVTIVCAVGTLHQLANG
jgi:uncharacterized protein